MPVIKYRDKTLFQALQKSKSALKRLYLGETVFDDTVSKSGFSKHRYDGVYEFIQKHFEKVTWDTAALFSKHNKMELRDVMRNKTDFLV